jgi:molybdate transport system substrate-binding protein
LWSQLKNEAVLAEDVKQLFVYVERGDKNAGFVYNRCKDCTTRNYDYSHQCAYQYPISYTIAVVSSSTHKEKAQKFIDLVTGKDGQDILNTYGFVLQS